MEFFPLGGAWKSLSNWENRAFLIFTCSGISNHSCCFDVCRFRIGRDRRRLRYSKPPRTLTGNYNVTIAPFGEIQADGSIKAHTSLGNVYVVIAQAHHNDPELFAKAIENYRYVVNTYERTQDPFIRGSAAIAYFGTGAAYERQEDVGQAKEAYSQAYDLTDDSDFKDRISKQIAGLGTP